MSTPDRMEKKITLKATPERVWRALANSREFGQWFRADLRDDFKPGATVRGKILSPGYEHLTLEMTIERMDKEKLFSFRWHPNATEPDRDYSNEPTTLVEFRLEPAGDGTLLTLTESGFSKLPDSDRKAFDQNSSGWDEQLQNIERHVA
jgi:uncharacterized protein YndB with AHSA1/START domain